MRYVPDLPEGADLAQIDTALRTLRTKRQGTLLPVVQRWIDAEIDEVLDLRNMLDLETRALT